MSKTRPVRTWRWPEGAKLAFSVGIPLEDFELQSQLNYVAVPGKKDMFSLTYGDYGWRVGVWRLLDLLEPYGIKASVSVNGLFAERHPQIVRTLADEGHEINGHGWANDVYAKDAGPESERAEIARCTRVLTEAAGVRPIGWTSPGSSGSEHTIALLREHGYLWVGDDASDDVPFIEETPHGSFVVLPRTNMASNDITMWLFPKNPPSAFFESFKDTFDQLYAEGQAGSPKWLDLTLHSHMAGRATLGPTIRKCLDYARQHEGVHFTRKCDIARYTLDNRETLPVMRSAS